MELEILTTERLKLRMVTPEIFQYVFEKFSEEDLMKFFGADTDETLQKERIKLKNGLQTYNRSFLYFHMLDAATDTVIGSCGYHTWYTEHQRAEIGYSLFSDETKGKGLMTEAIKPIIKYGFDKMNLNRIEALIGPKNIPSLRLIKNLHFTEEGRLRQHYFKNGVMEDSVVFSLLKDEYKP